MREIALTKDDSWKRVTDTIIQLNTGDNSREITAFWEQFSCVLEADGYEEKTIQADQTKISTDMSRTYAYVSDKATYVYLFICSKRLNWYIPVVLNKSSFDDLSGGLFYMLQGRHDSVYLPNVKTDEKGLVKLHKAICPVEDAGLVVDHIAGSPSIVTCEMLRSATLQQNRMNTLFYSTTNKNYFTGCYTMTDAEKNMLLEKGYKLKNPILKSEFLTRYNVTSPKYVSEQEMFKNLNECENKFLGKFRYDPIKACVSMKDVMLYFCKLFYKWSEKDYVQAKRYLIEATHKDSQIIFQYYNL